MRATRLLEYAISKKPATVLDIAVGPGKHAQCFIANGSHVTGVDVKDAPFEHENYVHIAQNYETLKVKEDAEKFDMIWCCHTLEHIPNAQHFLIHLASWLKDDGWLAISVPPSMDRLHVGHLSLWTPAHLAYNLICAGWDCRDARWYTEYCSIGFMVQKRPEIDLSWRTGMPSETLALNKFMPIVVNHEDNAWWLDNWHEPTGKLAIDPPHVTLGYQRTNLAPQVQLAYGPNPALRKPPGEWLH